jgi:hypothetical protein
VETLSAIIRDEPPAIEQLNPAVPAPVRWIIDRCLAKAPADRYGSTRDLARDLASAGEHLAELTSSAATPVSAVLPVQRMRGRELVAWSLTATLILAGVGLMVSRQDGQPANAVQPVRFTISPPENIGFDSYFAMAPFAISPDGRHLVFVGVGKDGTRSLWHRSLDALASRPLAGTEGALGPFWSPNNLDVGFFTEGHLKRASIAGGGVAIICEARFGTGATWNRDGVIVFAPGDNSPLFRVAEAGGTPTQFTKLDPAHQESAHWQPLFLPDGRHFLFAIIGGDTTGTYIASLDTPERKRLSPLPAMHGFASPDFLFFMRDRTLVAQRLHLNRLELIGDPMRVAEGVDQIGPGAAFAVSESGTVVHWAGARNITQPTWFRRDGRAAGTLGPAAAYMNIAVSSNGLQVAADRFDATPGIWLLDAVRGTATRATQGEIYESTPVWSPKSDVFVFAAARQGPPNLLSKRVREVGDAEHLFGTPSKTLFPQSWSSDGRFLAYVDMDPKTNADIWVLAVAGDRKPIAVLQTTFEETHARISPNSRWMAYSSDESGMSDVYVTRFPEPGGTTPVSTNGGGFPVWRRDGRELFYQAPDGTLMAVPVGPPGPDFAPGAPIPLFKPPGVIGDLGLGTHYDVAPDGRFLVNVLVERTSAPLSVVLNWRAGQ